MKNEPKTKRLWEACERGDLHQIQSLWKEGVSIKKVDDQGRDVLMRTLISGSVPAIEWLIEKGADVNRQDADGRSTLMYAVKWCDEETVTRLLKAGADVGTISHAGENVLFYALRRKHSVLEVFDVLMKTGVSVNVYSVKNVSPLGLAISLGLNACRDQLIKAGAETEGPFLQYSILKLACAREDAESLKVILDHSEKRTLDVLNDDVVSYAARVGLWEMMELLIEKGFSVHKTDEKGLSAIMNAARSNKARVIQQLIEKGCDLKKTEGQGKTALMIACENGHWESALVLLNNGAGINEVDHQGETALMKAIRQGNQLCVEGLLKKKAAIDQVDSRGRTALMHAVQCNYLEGVRVLNEHGADWSIVDSSGQTAYSHARGQPIEDYIHSLEEGVLLKKHLSLSVVKESSHQRQRL